MPLADVVGKCGRGVNGRSRYAEAARGGGGRSACDFRQPRARRATARCAARARAGAGAVPRAAAGSGRSGRRRASRPVPRAVFRSQSLVFHFKAKLHKSPTAHLAVHVSVYLMLDHSLLVVFIHRSSVRVRAIRMRSPLQV